MSYEERPYVTERPDELRRRWDTCPQAGLDPASTPKWQLERWKLVRDLVVAWYSDPRNDDLAVPELIEAQLSWLDPVQREVVERMFAGWRAMYPKLDDVEVDAQPPAASHVDHEAAIELRVSPTFDLTYGDGTVERVRLRTGRFGSGPDDASVLRAGSDPGCVFVDAMVAHGVAEEIVAPDDAERRLRELVALAGRSRRVPLVPGPHCFSCASAARCGQYPLLTEGRVFVSTRSVVVSKSQLSWIDTCHRRVSWDRVFSVPVLDDSELEPRAGRSAGVRFHELAAAAMLADNPRSVVETGCSTVEPSEASELLRLWDAHVELMDADGPPEVRRVEYPAGFTILAPGVHVDSRGRESTQPVAVTFVGVLDATGREPDGTPMVIEHRTGRTGEHSHLEQELYALAAASSVRATTGEWPARISVHLHHLRPDPPECTRRVFEEADLGAAVSRFRDVAGSVATWHPHDSLSPSFSVGPWCGGCPHEGMCRNHR